MTPSAADYERSELSPVWFGGDETTINTAEV